MFPQVSKVGDGCSIIPSESSSPSRRTFDRGRIYFADFEGTRSLEESTPPSSLRDATSPSQGRLSSIFLVIILKMLYNKMY